MYRLQSGCPSREPQLTGRLPQPRAPQRLLRCGSRNDDVVLPPRLFLICHLGSPLISRRLRQLLAFKAHPTGTKRSLDRQPAARVGVICSMCSTARYPNVMLEASV